MIEFVPEAEWEACAQRIGQGSLESQRLRPVRIQPADIN